MALALKQVREIPSSLLIHRPDLPVEIDRLVMKLMAKNPADRYQSAAEMLADLAKVREIDPGRRRSGGRGDADAADGPIDASARRPCPDGRAGPGSRRYPPSPRRGPPGRPAARATEVGRPGATGPRSIPPASFRMIATAAAAVGLLAGGLAGWAARARRRRSRSRRTVAAFPGPLARSPTGGHPRQASPEEQYALRPVHGARGTSGRRPGSPSRAIIPNRTRHLEGLHPARPALVSPRRRRVAAALGPELAAWKDEPEARQGPRRADPAGARPEEGRPGRVTKGFEKLTDAEVADMYDPALVAFNLEVCADALRRPEVEDPDHRRAAAPGLAAAVRQLEPDRDRRACHRGDAGSRAVG